MATQDLHLEEVRNQKDLMAFIRLPWDIHRGNRYWVPPLIKEELTRFSPTHPFLAHADMVLFLARKKDEIAGRVAVIIDKS